MITKQTLPAQTTNENCLAWSSYRVNTIKKSKGAMHPYLKI
jgi:hypothetical protein